MEKCKENQPLRPLTDTKDILSEISPDPELLVWEKWIQIRKEETTKLGKKLHRAPVDLAMNLPEKVREDIERKTALEYAQIQKKPATIRGSLFERPPKLKQCCYCAPVYEVHRTRAELGHPRIIEHVNVPTYIQKTELGMSGEPHRVNCQQLDAEYKKYREKREKDLKQNIKKIDPFKPSISQLMICGHKPKTPPPKIPKPPKISVDEPTSEAMVSISGVYAVKINNSIFYKEPHELSLIHLSKLKNQSGHEECLSWTYYFNAPAKRVGRGKLFLQNLGTVTLRYCWKKIKRQIQFIPTDVPEQVFFFNKNEDVLSPGQSKYICFTFISDRPGIYNEFWELCFFNVNFFTTTSEKFTIDLYADSVENAESMTRQVELLKCRIRNKTLYALCNEFVDEAFDRVFAIVPQIYPYKKYFIEGQLFVMKNPVCFYHQTEVTHMKEMYEKEMAPGQTWDLSISNWRKIMMEKRFDDRMKYFDVLKKSHSECLKPWYEGDQLIKDKYRAMNNLWCQFANNLDIEYERIRNNFIKTSDTEQSTDALQSVEILIDPLTEQKIHNIFYIHAYDHLVTTIELCAGVLSSLDSNKWIEFDFCQS
ncbi:unnamed protein product [Arctia plantaginis]|uniref:MYCBP-associated protein n=1 Tax=Arctia plantaginis TaxID=874455 RepID=A0A8S1A012_ARCPL|nr:unnamed protein product [Arctia plantaginis]